MIIRPPQQGTICGSAKYLCLWVPRREPFFLFIRILYNLFMPVKKLKKIAIAMSGGVDSSVAAKMLAEKYSVSGFFLHFWKEEIGDEEGENKCCSVKSLNDARRVAQKLDMPLYTLNFNQVFKKKIVDDFLSEYQAGRTPNPCVRCNKMVKLGLLIKRARELGFDAVASGHYVRLKKSKGKYKLFKAADKNKDQSYFLYTFTQDELSHLVFPLGEFTKDKIREIAKKAGLGVAEKKESQEICFIPGRSHNDFLKRHLELKPGLIKTRQGEVVGRHQGLSLYTIGQRKGVEVGGKGPYYVSGFDYKKNILFVVNDSNNKSLYKDGLVAKHVNWISGQEPEKALRCEAVIRYRHAPVKCIVRKKGRSHEVAFNEPQRAVTPGQSVVFYRGEELLGGGVIAEQPVDNWG